MFIVKKTMENDTHRDIQEKLLNKLFFIFGIIAIPTLIISLSRFFSIGWQPIFGVHIILTMVFLLISIYRKSISYHIKVAILIGIFYILGISAALNLGLGGLFVAFLMLSVFIGIVFWGKKPSLIIHFGGIASILAMGVLMVKEIISPNIDIASYSQFYSSWITTTVGFALIAGLCLLVVGEIGHILAHKIKELKRANLELKTAHDEIQTLSGMLPICASCKKIRDDKGYWNRIESYITDRSEATFSHGICPTCLEKLYQEEFDLLKAENKLQNLSPGSKDNNNK